MAQAFDALPQGCGAPAATPGEARGTAAGEKEEGARTLKLAITPLAADGREQAVRLLAQAFRDNPLNRAVIDRVAGRGSAARRMRCNELGMRASLLSAASAGATLLAARATNRPDGLLGTLLAAAPGQHPFPLPPWRVRLRTLWGQGLRVAQRWSEVFDQLEAEREPSDHVGWYLALLGVAPESQGHRVGSALLEEWLTVVDRDHLGAHLETDQERNLAFYERAGFQVAGELRVLGVPIWRMQRPPRP